MISVTTQTKPVKFLDGDELDFITLSGAGDPVGNELLGITPAARKIVEIIPDELENEVNIDALMDEIVEDAREVVGTIPKLRIVNDFKIVNPPITNDDQLDVKKLETLEMVDPEFTNALGVAPKNYMMETYVLGLLDGYLKILREEQLPNDLHQQLVDLKDIAMRKDMIAAMQKWDVIAYNMEDKKPTNAQLEAFADLEAILRVIKKVFFTKLNLY